MKRFVALLLALLLPVCSLAETLEVTLQVQTAETLFSAMLDRSIQRKSGTESASAEVITKLMRTLLGNTRITMITQEDASSFSISLNGTDFLDMTTHLDGEKTLLTSGLIPGYVLVENTGADATDNAADEQKITEDIQTAWLAWKKTIASENTYGVFSGDAYTGGTSCTTWTITDRDIAALVSAVMTPDLRAMIQDQTEKGNAQEDILAAFDAANEKAAEKNQYSYVLRCVKDAQENAVGASATIFDQEKQVATISVGFGDEALRLVIGLGLKQQNYWAECVLTKTEREKNTFLKGELREWTADKSESFAYVAQANAPAMSYLMNCVTTKSGQRILWDGHVYLGTKADAGREVLSFSGSSSEANQTLVARFSLMENRQSLMNLSLSMKPTDAIQPPDPSLVRCSETDPDQGELYTKISQEFAFTITMRLLQVIPFDLLMKMDGLMP